jgi:hypothetical protein
MDEYHNKLGQQIAQEVFKVLQADNKDLVGTIIPQQWQVYLDFDEKQVKEAYKTKYVKDLLGNLRVDPDKWRGDPALREKVDMMVKRMIIAQLENGRGVYLDDDPRIKCSPRWRPNLKKGY